MLRAGQTQLHSILHLHSSPKTHLNLSIYLLLFYFLKASVRSRVFALVLEGCIVAFPEAQLQDCGF